MANNHWIIYDLIFVFACNIKNYSILQPKFRRKINYIVLSVYTLFKDEKYVIRRERLSGAMRPVLSDIEDGSRIN